MRRYVIEYFLLGASIGLIAIVIQIFTGGASRAFQLLAVGLAGIVLSGILMLLERRGRRASQPQADSLDAEEDTRRLQRYRRDPFTRELTQDWTGLHAYQPPLPPADEALAPLANEPSKDDGAPER